MQPASPSPPQPASRLLSTPPSASSPRPAGCPQNVGPPPATYTTGPDDRPDTSCPPGGAGKEPDAQDRSHNYQTLRRCPMPAPQTIAFHPHESTNRVSSPHAAATHQIAPICRCRSETAATLSTASCPCSSAKTQTMALRSFAQNKAPCRCPTESPPANRRARRPIRRGSMDQPPDSSSGRDRLSPAAHKFSWDHKNLPGPTNRQRSTSAPWPSSANTASPAPSRTHRSSDAARN